MPDRLVYLDSSALVKLVLPEAQTEALRAFLTAWPRKATSKISAVEVRRVARRGSAAPEVMRRAGELVASLHLIEVSDGVLETAARLDPLTLRSLDAIHLASALSLGEDLGAMAVYDLALADAARTAGLTVLAPA